MTQTVTLSGEEAAGILAAACEYNGLAPVTVHVYDAAGVEVHLGKVTIDCQAAGLKVRTAPEDDDPGTQLLKRMEAGILERLMNPPEAVKPEAAKPVTA